MPDDLPLLSHDDILRYEEIIRLCEIFAKIGIRAIKVTGGEPLARKGCVEFIGELKARTAIEHVTLTTNAVLLEPYVEKLAGLKLDGINISLDSLDSETYKKITGKNEFHRVWRSLNAAVEAGLCVKINMVPIKGINERDIVSIVRLAETLPINVRFIELMPTGVNNGFKGISGIEIRRLLQKIYLDLTPDLSAYGFGPASYFKSKLLKRSIGFIKSFDNHFCESCNRVRLTSEGYLKLCLYQEDGLELRRMLRSGASDNEIEAAIAQAIYQKPKHRYVNANQNGEIKKMSRIGG